MKKILLCLSVLGMAGCAANPSDISAQYTSPEPFMRQSCAQLAQMDQMDTQNLASAEMHQRRMHQSDAWGVALIGVPVGSAGGDRHKEIGELKGQLEAIHTAERGKNCVGRYSATDYDPTGALAAPAGRLPTGGDPAYGYRGAGSAVPAATPDYPPLQTTPTDISTGTGTGTGITSRSTPAQEGLSAPDTFGGAPSHAPTYTAPHYVVPPAGYTAPSYSGNPFQ